MTVVLGDYKSPGVTTQAVPGPQIGVFSNAPTAVGIFGDTRRSNIYTENITVPWDSIESDEDTGGEVDTDPEDPGEPSDDPEEEEIPVPEDVDGTGEPAGGNSEGTTTITPNPHLLVKAGVDLETIKVVDPITGTEFQKGVDYTTKYVDPLATNAVGTVTRTLDGALEENLPVRITYNYVTDSYFEARSFYDFDDVRDAFGPAFDKNGKIISELTLAAQFAFVNGASHVVLSPLQVEGTSEATLDDYVKALNKLANVPSISVVCSASGDPKVFSSVKQHVVNQSNNASERRAILGLDGTKEAYSTGDRLVKAGELSQQRVALVSPSRFGYFESQTNDVVEIGSQFIACGIAGYSVSQSPSQPLTRKNIEGISTFPEEEVDQVKTQESAGGLMVVERTRRGTVRIRHGVTTNPSTLLTREWSIIGQEDAMAIRMRNLLDDDGIIGSPIDDTTLINVKASADTALQSLVRDEVIRDYQELKVRQTPEQPDVIEIRYEWRASVPLNYIVVRYSINMSTGELLDSGSETV